MPEFIRKIHSLSDENFISALSFLTYLSLWYFNPSNKQIFAVFLLFLLVLYWKTRSLKVSLLVTYLLSSVIFVGKTYEYQLFDFKKYPDVKKIYPSGHGVSILISVSDIVSFFMLITVIKDIVFNSRRRIGIFSGLLIMLLLWSIFANILSSNKVFISLYLTIKVLQLVVLDFFLKFFNDAKKFRYVFHVFMVIVLFQSFTAFHQFINFSPLGKSIESVFSPTLFGSSADETYFISRPIGTFGHANDLGIYISALLPLLFSLFFISKQWTFFVALLSGLITVLLTLSRAAWTGLIVSTLTYLYLLEHRLKIKVKKFFDKKILIALLACSPFIIYALPRIAKTFYSFDESGGAYLRLKQASEVLHLIQNSPVFGVGTGMSVLEAIEFTRRSVFLSFPFPIHNYYLLTAVETGIVGFIITIAIVIILFLSLAKSVKKSMPLKRKVFLYALLSSSVVIIVAGFFQPFMYISLLIIFYHLKDVTIEA